MWTLEKFIWFFAWTLFWHDQACSQSISTFLNIWIEFWTSDLSLIYRSVIWVMLLNYLLEKYCISIHFLKRSEFFIFSWKDCPHQAFLLSWILLMNSPTILYSILSFFTIVWNLVKISIFQHNLYLFVRCSHEAQCLASVHLSILTVFAVHFF